MRRSIGLDQAESPDLEITRMRRRHLKGVMSIERVVYPRPWSPSLFLSEMSSGRTRCYLVALGGRDVLGYGGLISYGDESHVTTIAVDPDQQRRKIGTRLMYELVRESQRMGAHAVSLEVRVTNWAAQEDVRAIRLQAGRGPQGLLPGDERGRPRDVDGRRARARVRAPPSTGDGRRSRGSPGLVRVLGIETSCDETAVAVVDRP